jgi:hypothetical protein
MHDHVIDSKRKPQLQKEYADYVEQLGNYGHPINSMYKSQFFFCAWFSQKSIFS